MANNWQQISSGNTRFRHVRSEEGVQTASQTVRRVRTQSILAKLRATEGCLKRARSPNLFQLFLDRSSSCLFVRLMPAAAKHGAVMPVPRVQDRLRLDVALLVPRSGRGLGHVCGLPRQDSLMDVVVCCGVKRLRPTVRREARSAGAT
jgi:hypothetical protein